MINIKEKIYNIPRKNEIFIYAEDYPQISLKFSFRLQIRIDSSIPLSLGYQESIQKKSNNYEF